MVVDQSPLRGVGAAIVCPVCQSRFAPIGRQLYCCKLCRDTAYRRRRSGFRPVTVPPARFQRPVTVYRCESCGERSLSSQRCEQCLTFKRKIGLGGCCPHCNEPVTVLDLLGKEVVSKAIM